MTEVYVKNVTSTPISHGSEDHGIRDQKARRIGYNWEIRLEHFEVLPEREDGCYRYGQDRLDKPYRVWGSPTRNGGSYGPHTGYRYFASLDAAQKNVADRIKNARKRDTKKFAKENA
jgi:hypothetical protein